MINYASVDQRRKPLGSLLLPGNYSGPSPDGVRRDGLPESGVGTGYYRDTGCTLRPECLVCDLPECIEDTRMLLPARRAARDDEIRRLRKRKVPTADIASKFGVSERSVHRVTASKRRKR